MLACSNPSRAAAAGHHAVQAEVPELEISSCTFEVDLYKRIAVACLTAQLSLAAAAAAAAAAVVCLRAACHLQQHIMHALFVSTHQRV
jgi:hypothetical protein